MEQSPIHQETDMSTESAKTMTFEQIDTLSAVYQKAAGPLRVTCTSVHPYSGALTVDNGRETQVMIAPDGHITYASKDLHALAEAVNALWPWVHAVDEGRPADKVA